MKAEPKRCPHGVLVDKSDFSTPPDPRECPSYETRVVAVRHSGECPWCLKKRLSNLKEACTHFMEACRLLRLEVMHGKGLYAKSEFEKGLTIYYQELKEPT